MKMDEKTHAEKEIVVLGQLSQGAAAWLLGVTTRTLRDRALPRSADGRYSARDLLAHAVQRAVAIGKVEPRDVRYLETLLEDVNG